MAEGLDLSFQSLQTAVLLQPSSACGEGHYCVGKCVHDCIMLCDLSQETHPLFAP